VLKRSGTAGGAALRPFRTLKNGKINRFPEKNQEKPQKSCGNRGFPIDKSCWKPQG
jgi:hypothetical protein